VKEIAEYLQLLAAGSEMVAPETIPANVLRDPRDAPILGTALAGKAEFLCTRDADFYEDRVIEFCSNHGIEVLSDLEFIDKVQM
jgi:predicted nucleic acid-binding protein